MKTADGLDVVQNSWKATCPGCKRVVHLPMLSVARFCGNPACYRKGVLIVREPSELPPSHDQD